MKERLKSPRLRLFVALELPNPVLDQLVAWQREAFGERTDLRLLPRGSLHVTLVFLGYQERRDVEQIEQLTFDQPAGPFALRPSEVAEVPKGRPRLYALGLEEPGEDLGRWQSELSQRLHGAGLYEPEKRPFWPHVTVARIKSRRGGDRGARRGRNEAVATTRAPGEDRGLLPALPDALRQDFQAPRITLYQSTLRPQGALYEPLASLKLGRN